MQLVCDADVLLGGTANRDLVCRISDTVHRPQGSYSVAVHQLLRHLEGSGFTGSHRVLGTHGQTENCMSELRSCERHSTASMPPST